ncbi:MAG: hypothetical protein B6I20_09710 [Bacteroidetes bacterium 4572_117]|nr:MAG: hypothetical protein B6I20_09710 [Bacteroidetes bacterium 4572_117]
MPLILKTDNNNCIFGLWQITEPIEKLKNDFDNAPKEEKENLGKFKNPKRQAEWIIARLLIYEIIEKKTVVDYDEYGKPSLRDDKRQVSISHTDGMVAVQIGNIQAGVDVEKVSGRVAKIAHKFLNSSELDSIDIHNQLLHMYVHWGAKETVYKIYGKKRLDFKENIRIEPFKIEKKGTIKAILKTKEIISFDLDYFVYDLPDQTKYMIVRYCK